MALRSPDAMISPAPLGPTNPLTMSVIPLVIGLTPKTSVMAVSMPPLISLAASKG